MLQLHLDSGQMSGRLCDFAVEQVACASVRLNTSWINNSPKTTVVWSCVIVMFSMFCDLLSWITCCLSALSSHSCQGWQQRTWQWCWRVITPQTPAAPDPSGSFSSPKRHMCWKKLWIFWATRSESATLLMLLFPDQIQTVNVLFLSDSGPQKSCSVSGSGLYKRNPIGHIERGQLQ